MQAWIAEDPNASMFEKGRVLGKGKGKTEGEKGQGKGQCKKDSILPPECVPFLPPEPADATLPPNARKQATPERPLDPAPGPPPHPPTQSGTLMDQLCFQQPPGPPPGPPPMEAPEPQMEPPNTTPNKMHGAAAPKTEEKGVNKMPKEHEAMEFPPRGA